MDQSWQELFDFLEQLGNTLEKLTGIEQEKTAAVRRDDLLGVNECMKQEQAISLSLRSMDVKREKLYAGLGLDGKRLSALPGSVPPQYREQASQVAERVRSQFQIYHSAADVAQNTLEVNLHQIEKLISDAEAAAPPRSGGVMADIRA